MTLYETIKNTYTKVMDSYATLGIIGAAFVGILGYHALVGFDFRISKTRVPFRFTKRVERQEPLEVIKTEENTLEKVVKKFPAIKINPKLDSDRFVFPVGKYTPSRTDDKMSETTHDKYTNKDLLKLMKKHGQAEDSSHKRSDKQKKNK